MRRLTRPELRDEDKAKLTQLSDEVRRCPDHAAKVRCAEARWRETRGHAYRRQLAKKLYQMNGNHKICMYCEYNESLVVREEQDRISATIDHWEPRGETPERAFDWSNMFASCEICNTRLKGTQFPRDALGQPLLLHLVDDEIHDHVVFEPSNGALKEKNASVKGEKTLDLFDLRRFERRRIGVWSLLLVYLKRYDALVAANDQTHAAATKADILDLPFPSLRTYLVQIALGPNGDLLTAPEIPGIVKRHNIGAWG